MSHMQKIFLETSYFIRFFTKDDSEKFQECVDLIELIKLGKIHPYISNIVILEIVFVLTRIYKFPVIKILPVLKDTLQLRNITLIEKTDTKLALKFFQKTNIKYSDCLISTQVPEGVLLVTYDSDFSKINSLTTSTPKEITKLFIYQK